MRVAPLHSSRSFIFGEGFPSKQTTHQRVPLLSKENPLRFCSFSPSRKRIEAGRTCFNRLSFPKGAIGICPKPSFPPRTRYKHRQAKRHVKMSFVFFGISCAKGWTYSTAVGETVQFPGSRTNWCLRCPLSVNFPGESPTRYNVARWYSYDAVKQELF